MLSSLSRAEAVRPVLYPRHASHATSPIFDRPWSVGESVPPDGDLHETSAPTRPLPAREEAARRADVLAVSLRGALDLLTSPLARAAAAFVDAEGWTEFGHARLEDHARERFGRSGRWVKDLASLGRMFSVLPGLEAAVCGTDGGRALGRVAGLLVGRVASTATLDRWVARARAVSVRELKLEVAGARGDTEASPRSHVRLMAPAPVAAAFDEALDLYRAVEGHQASVMSFVEALVAEASAGERPAGGDVDADLRGLSRGEAIGASERAMAASTNNWEHLPEAEPSDWAMRLAGSSLRRIRELMDGPPCADVSESDRRIRDALALEDEIETRLAALMAQMADDGAWARLRFASSVHYAEQRLGMRRTAARMRVRVARAVRRWPLLREAYERGDVGMEAAWLVARSMGRGDADPGAQQLWIDRARRATVKRLRDETRLGDRTGLPVADTRWHESLRREGGTAIRRVAALGRQAASARGSDVFLRLRLPEDLAVELLGAIEAARESLQRKVERVPWDRDWPEPDPPGSVLAARAFFVRCRRTPAWVGLLAMLEDFVGTWDVEDPAARPAGRRIFVRDGWRCSAPGCTSRRNLEEHHIVYRSRGGSHDPANRITLCRFHHQRGEHGGLARCRGEAPLQIDWSLGREGRGGRFRCEIRRSERSFRSRSSS